jgi:ketosteroid isomerase-like protein
VRLEQPVTIATYDLIRSYYAAFNRQDAEGMLAMLAENVVHEPSQGAPRRGKDALASFWRI